MCSKCTSCKSCNHKVRDFAKAFSVRKLFGTFEKRDLYCVEIWISPWVCNGERKESPCISCELNSANKTGHTGFFTEPKILKWVYYNCPCRVLAQRLKPGEASSSISQSVNQSISQSVNQSISQSVNQSISQSVNQSISQSVNQSISQSTNHYI